MSDLFVHLLLWWLMGFLYNSPCNWMSCVQSYELEFLDSCVPFIVAVEPCLYLRQKQQKQSIYFITLPECCQKPRISALLPDFAFGESSEYDIWREISKITKIRFLTIYTRPTHLF